MLFGSSLSDIFSSMRSGVSPLDYASSRTSASKGNISSIVSDYKSIKDNTLDNLSGSYLSEGQLTSLMKMLSEAEINSANTQMAFQREMNQNAMNFSAEQAVLDRAFQQQSAQKAMDFTADQNQKAMDFSKMMSDTSYQRAVLDLKKAGLNPILAYQNGGASAMQGSAGTGVSASGSSASGVTSSGSKANISSIASAVLNYSSSIVSNSAKLLSAVGQIIPG